MMFRTMKSLLCGAAFGPSALPPALVEELNLYATRKSGLIQPLLDAFTEASGVTVNTIFLKDGLTERTAKGAINSLLTC